MMTIKAIVQIFIQNKSGLTAVEYFICGGLIIGGMIITFNTLSISATKSIDCMTVGIEGGKTLERNEHAQPTPPRNPHCFK